MVAKKNAPVKPPTIDLTAKNAENKQNNKQKNASKAKKNNKTSKNNKESANGFMKKIKNWKEAYFSPPIIFAIFCGAFIAIIFSFVLALIGLWPQKEPSPDLMNSPANIAALENQTKKLTQSIEENSQNLIAIKSRLKIVEQTQQNMAEQNQAIKNRLTKINEEILLLNSTLLTKEDLPEPVDLTNINKKIEFLSDKIATIDAGANSADASAIINSISLLREQSELLSEEINNLRAVNSENQIKIDALNEQITKLNEKNTKLAEQLSLLDNKETIINSTPNQLELNILAFKGAINSGQPFSAELAAIKTSNPNINIDNILLENAASGFSPPREIAKQFALLVPQLLAAKPIDKNATLGQKLKEKIFSLLAIRPIGKVEGDSLEAIIANIEDALEKNDFLRAEKLFNSLPKELKPISNNIAEQVANLAKAQKFINELEKG